MYKIFSLNKKIDLSDNFDNYTDDLQKNVYSKLQFSDSTIEEDDMVSFHTTELEVDGETTYGSYSKDEMIPMENFKLEYKIAKLPEKSVVPEYAVKINYSIENFDENEDLIENLSGGDFKVTEADDKLHIEGIYESDNNNHSFDVHGVEIDCVTTSNNMFYNSFKCVKRNAGEEIVITSYENDEISSEFIDMNVKYIVNGNDVTNKLNKEVVEYKILNIIITAIIALLVVLALIVIIIIIIKRKKNNESSVDDSKKVMNSTEKVVDKTSDIGNEDLPEVGEKINDSASSNKSSGPLFELGNLDMFKNNSYGVKLKHFIQGIDALLLSMFMIFVTSVRPEFGEYEMFQGESIGSADVVMSIFAVLTFLLICINFSFTNKIINISKDIFSLIMKVFNVAVILLFVITLIYFQTNEYDMNYAYYFLPVLTGLNIFKQFKRIYKLDMYQKYLVISILFLFLNLMKVSMNSTYIIDMSFDFSFSIFDIKLDDLFTTEIKVISSLLLIAAIVLSIKEIGIKNSKLISVLALAIFNLISLIIVAVQFNNEMPYELSEFGIDVSIGLTFAGFIYLIISLLVIAYIIMKLIKSKKIK